jgi:hypothetical protein
MITYTVPIQVTEAGRLKAVRMDKLKKTIRPGAAIAGHIGEWAYQQLRPTAKYVDLADYDFLFNGLRVEIKAVAQNGIPRHDHHWNVSEKSRHQQHDRFVFCSVLNDFSQVFIVGWLTREEFFGDANRKPIARFFKDGETWEEGHKMHNKWKAHGPTWVVCRSQLRGFQCTNFSEYNTKPRPMTSPILTTSTTPANFVLNGR